MRVLILNGPNLNLLGTREPEIYGRETLPDIEARIRKRAATLRVEVEFRQTNYEGDLIQAIQSSQKRVQGIILNAAGYTHTSVGLLDAIIAVDVPVIEVHLSNIHAREEFRRTSLLSPACIGQITGLGAIGYELALIAIINYRPLGAEKIETVETEVREEKRPRRARPRGGRGRGRQRTDVRPSASDRTGSADEAKSSTEPRKPDKPEKEEEVDVTERYKHLEGVVVRRGVDVLEGPEPDDSALNKGSGSVSFSSDEPNQEAARESTAAARPRRQTVSSPSKPSRPRAPAARTKSSADAGATVAFRSAHAPEESGKDEAASTPAASPAAAREKSKPAAAKSPRKKKAPAAKKTPRAKSPSTRSRAKKSKS